jgi:uncharacterized protein (DUF362 family)
MERREFVKLTAAAAPAAALRMDKPKYQIVSAYKPAAKPGMPGRYPGEVVSVKALKSIDPATEKVDADVVAEMIRRGMTTLTGESKPRDAWRTFFDPSDVIGIKVNCSGAPGICSHPVVVAEIVRNLVAAEVQPKQIYIYERFPSQMETVKYERYVPQGVNIFGVEPQRTQIQNYDPKTYVEVDFFGEEDTRSHLVRMVSERFTKIINVPNMKEHNASGVTGCLKNIAYGNFNNVARSHRFEKTNTLTFIGTLASVEPLRSKTVLSVMDGLKGVWHGGPFSPTKKFRFYPASMMFGTDPVAMDRLLIDVIENKRKAEGALTIWDYSMANIDQKHGLEDPHKSRFLREPGHIEYASKLGLGVYDKAKIRERKVEL